MDAHQLGFNDHFVEEVSRLLAPFPKHTRTLRNAALHVVADRHSFYLGRDECPTRAYDIKRILLSPNLQPQFPRSAVRYAARLLARLGRLEYHESCERILSEFPDNDLLHSLKAAAACVILGASLARVARYTSFTPRQILRAVATCLATSYERIVQLFDNLPLPPTRPRRFNYVAHLSPLAVGDELPPLFAAPCAARGPPATQAPGDSTAHSLSDGCAPYTYRF